MQHSKIHEYVCDYVEGRLDPDLTLQLEALMGSNQILRSFVENAQKGRAQLHNYAEILTQQGEDSLQFNISAKKKGRLHKLRFRGLYVLMPLIAVLAIFVKIKP